VLQESGILATRSGSVAQQNLPLATRPVLKSAQWLRVRARWLLHKGGEDGS
jgi:hypothetical protein